MRVAVRIMHRYNELMNIKKLFASHRIKIIVGTPIIFLLLINSSKLGGLGNAIILSPGSAFAETGSEVTVNVNITTRTPVNAIGGIIEFSPEYLALDSVTRDNSIIDLWSEEPTIASTTVGWSGGLLESKSELPASGNVLTLHMRALKPGKTTLAVMDGQLLAADGAGSNVFSGSETLTIYVRAAGSASPDVNDDGVLSISDANTLYLKTFRPYDKRYDMNNDRKLDWSDVKTLIALF